MLSNNATANDFLRFIDNLKDYSQYGPIIVNNDQIKYADQCLDLLFKTPMVPQQSLIICAQHLYNQCLDMFDTIVQDICNLYSDYELSCPEMIDDDAIRTLMETKKELDSMESRKHVIDNMAKSLEKIFGFSRDTRHDCPFD